MNNQSKDSWAVNETLLQSYRSSSYMTQSIMLAVGVGVLGISNSNNPWIFTLIACIALIQMWGISFEVIRVRALVTDFYKHKLGERFYDNGKLIKSDYQPSTTDDIQKLTEETYVAQIENRKKINECAKLPMEKKLKNWRLTRIKSDIVLPFTFTLIWLVLSSEITIAVYGHCVPIASIIIFAVFLLLLCPWIRKTMNPCMNKIGQLILCAMREND